MQLMPDTAQEYGCAIRSRHSSRSRAAHATCALLRRQRRPSVGGGRLQRWHRCSHPLQGVPPYAETLAYVDKVMALYARYREAMGIRSEVPAR